MCQVCNGLTSHAFFSKRNPRRRECQFFRLGFDAKAGCSPRFTRNHCPSCLTVVSVTALRGRKRGNGAGLRRIPPGARRIQSISGIALFGTSWIGPSQGEGARTIVQPYVGAGPGLFMLESMTRWHRVPPSARLQRSSRAGAFSLEWTFQSRMCAP